MTPTLWRSVALALLAASPWACSDDDAGTPAPPEPPAPLCLDCGDDAAAQLLTPDVDGGMPDRCCATPCPDRLSLGPVLGAVSDHSVKVWARSVGDAELGVVYWPADAPDDAHVVLGDALGADTDYTGVVALDDLAADTEYEYRLLFVGATCAPPPLPSQRFRTLPPPGAQVPLRFGFGADISRPVAPVFDHVAELEPAFMLLVGDNVYTDYTEPTRAGYEAVYHEIWGGTALRAFMAHVPVFMMWDDHEITNNFFPGSSDLIDIASVTYAEYQHSHNPEPAREGVLYYHFSAGPVGFFVIDTRSFRSPNEAVDDANKSMLGAAQKQDLFDWLEGSTDLVKVIVSAVPFHDQVITGNDPWHGYATERAEIFRFLWDQGIEGVVLLSGDQHWSGVFRLEGENPGEVLYEFMPTPIGIENFAAPVTDSPQFLARDDDHEVYGIFDVDPGEGEARLVFTMCDSVLPCDPGSEPPPGTPLDLPKDHDNLPYGIELRLVDGRFELVEP